MFRIILKNTALLGLLLVSLPSKAVENPLTVTLQDGATTTLSQANTGVANYLVTLNPAVPGALQWRVTSGLPSGVTQVTTGTACGGVAACASTFNLSPGANCCLRLLMTGSNMTLGSNSIIPLVQSTPTPTYSGQGDTLSVTVTSAPTATLTVNPSALALSVTGLTPAAGGLVTTGSSRHFTIQNNGPETATGIVCPTSASPSITFITCAGCGAIVNGGTCTVTIAPSATASAAVGDATPTPITLTIQGNNTNTVSPTVNVLTYGSFYQAGWLFSIIETADTSLSIGGTVAAELDNAAQRSTEYSPNDDNTTTAMYSGTNGAANTSAMLIAYDNTGTYSARICTTYSAGGYGDWYLPAICQMGFGGFDTNFNCGASPGVIPNMQYNLLVTNSGQNFNFANPYRYWSSTASEFESPDIAWFQQFAIGGGDGSQSANGVGATYGIRCVRTIT